MANKVVSKRSGRPYGDDDMDNQTEDHQEKRVGRHEDTKSEGRDRQKSTSTATTHSSQSSLEPSPVIRPTDVQLEIGALELDAPARSDSELRDAFHPTQQQFAYSINELEKSLPTESRPANFGIVVPGVYRSSFPQTEDYGFIEGLKLKTIV
jgi:tyrosine-protein phosphatase SIW14